MSDARSITSPINGRMGGVRTDAGKSVSSKNAITHGAYSRNVVLSTEDQQVFNEFHHQYLDEWQPVGRTECDLVTQIAVAAWKIRRLYPVETDLWELAMAKHQQPDPGMLLESAMRNALAFDEMSKSRALENLYRAESHLRRQMDHAIRTLRLLQKDRKAGERPGTDAQIDVVQNEPIQPDPSIPVECLIHGYILPAELPMRLFQQPEQEIPPKAA